MKKSIFIILTFALFNCGCSSVGLVYRNADLYLQHKINDYTTFNTRQKETIRKEVSNYMAWHRKDALPEYIIFLQNLNGVAQYDGQLKVEEVARLRTHLHGLYKKTLLPAIQPTAKLLSNLDSLQVQGLGKTFVRDIQKQKKELTGGSDDENLDKRAEKTIDFLEWLAGSLSSDQESEIREMSRRLPFVSHIYIHYREANQGNLIAQLNAHAGTEKIAAFLSAWMFTPEQTRTAQHEHVIQSFENASDEMIVKIHGLLTPMQKDHVRKLITSYIEDMRSLSTGSQTAIVTFRQDQKP